MAVKRIGAVKILRIAIRPIATPRVSGVVTGSIVQPHRLKTDEEIGNGVKTTTVVGAEVDELDTGTTAFELDLNHDGLTRPFGLLLLNTSLTKRCCCIIGCICCSCCCMLPASRCINI